MNWKFRRLWGGLLSAAAWGAMTQCAAAQQSSWVTTGVTGRLIYVPDAEGDRLPDFSMVGYGAGKRDIPSDIPVVIHIDPVPGDNTQHIQNAINFAATRPLQANGFRGIVELGPGKFDVSGRINITTSGVVLRGAGGGDDLAANTHIVSQNRIDDIATSPYSPVIDLSGSTSGRTYGPQVQILDKRVPVGAQSIRVGSTSGMVEGGMIEIFRPSTQAWIEELGMHLIPGGEQWTAGSRDLRWQRTITRIEGNTVYFDAPMTTALDSQWGGGTVRTYNLPNRIRNVGVESLRGQSLDAREETNETRTPTFIRFTRVDDGFVRDVETRHFSYASVFTSEADGTQHITVDRVASRLPSGEVTGGRRYTFAMDAQLSVVQNSFADSGRHDFVTGSNVTGPIAFVNSSTANTRADSGPHHRWGNGLLFDNIDINGNAINVQNRWDSGSGHGWAGANVVVWNSEASSFIVQSPPTAQSWLIGSTGTVNAGNCHLGGATCAGFQESHGTKVIVGGEQSLYRAQKNDAADIREFHWSAASGSGNWNDDTKWDQEVRPGVYTVSMRDYRFGDIDNFALDAGAGSQDNPSIDPAWQAAIAATSTNPIVGLDRLAANQNVAFTMQHQLAAGERVVHGYLALSLKQSGEETSSDFVQLFDLSPEHRLSIGRIGWSGQINPTTPFVGVIDMGQFLDQLQTGSVNLQLSDDVGMDWALYAVTVATPKSDSVGPEVSIDGGSVLVDAMTPPIASLAVGGPAGGQLTLGQAGRLTINNDYKQDQGGVLTVDIGGTSDGQFGKLVVMGQALLDGALQIQSEDGFTPAVGAQFEFLSTAGGRAGTVFASPAIVPDLAGNVVWQLTYEQNAVIASVLSGTKFGDLNGDNQLTSADWSLFKSFQGTNFAGLDQRQAYFQGDLDGDFDHDLNDFIAFRTAYESARGAGSFTEMLRNVPEPPSAALQFLIGALLTFSRQLAFRKRCLPMAAKSTKRHEPSTPNKSVKGRC
jgi:hypothetical protein